MGPDSSQLGGVSSLAGSGSLSRTLEKGLLVLSLFDVEHSEWTLREIRQEAKLPKATAFRLVKTLEGLKYLTYNPQTGKYHLGSSMLRAAYLTLSHSELVRIADPILQKLAEETTETINLTVPTDQGVLLVDTVLTSRPFKPHNPPGMFMVGLANVHARIFLAYEPESVQESALAKPQQRRTEYTTTDAQKLAEQLALIKHEGVALSFQEMNLGMCAVGAPVFDSNGVVRASMAVVAPVERFGPAEVAHYGAAVKDAAAVLSRELGFR